MHKKFNLWRISGLSEFLNGATLSCRAKAPERRASVNDSPSMSLRAPGSVGAVDASNGGFGKEWRPRHRGRGSTVGAGCGPGLVSPPARRVRVARAPPGSLARSAGLSLRGRGAPFRACRVPFGGFAGVRQVLQARRVTLAFGLVIPPAPEAGAKDFGCRVARVRRAGTRLRKGPPILSGAAPYRQIRRSPPEERRVPPCRLRAAEPATAHEASGRAPPRARSSGHPPPAPGASFYLEIRWIPCLERLR